MTDPVGVRIGTSGPGPVIDTNELAPLIAVHVEALGDELRGCIDDARRAAASDPGPAPC